MILALALLAATAMTTVRAQRVEVGDPVPVTVRVTARPGSTVTVYPPRSEPPLFDVEETGPRLLQADSDGNAIWTFEVVPWSDGDLVVPAIHAEVAGQGSVSSNPVTLRAFNPLGKSAKNEKPKDIRDIMPFPSGYPWWMWLAAAVIFGGGLAALMRKKTPTKAVARVVPLPPLRTLGDMIDDVRRLVEHPPSTREEIRGAHFVVAEAVRKFVEERWDVPASRQTTEEFLAAIAAKGVRTPRANAERAVVGFGAARGGNGLEMLPAVLESCDRVKWAGDAVSPDDTVQLAKTALAFFAASREAARGLGGPEAGALRPPAAATGGEKPA